MEGNIERSEQVMKAALKGSQQRGEDSGMHSEGMYQVQEKKDTEEGVVRRNSGRTPRRMIKDESETLAERRALAGGSRDGNRGG